MTGGGTSLPERFPVFPLRGALLLPGGNLPLNIFEPRYLAMVRDAMQTDKIIGMIQPRGEGSSTDGPDLYPTGCAGRISNHEETSDGRYLIMLSGVCRFDVREELDVDTPYRQVKADFERWRGDLNPPPPPEALRPELIKVLETYFERQGVEVEWPAIRQAPLPGLITSLAMICPFGPSEKQALLEAKDMERQARTLVALMQMAVMGDAPNGGVRH